MDSRTMLNDYNAPFVSQTNLLKIYTILNDYDKALSSIELMSRGAKIMDL